MAACENLSDSWRLISSSGHNDQKKKRRKREVLESRAHKEAESPGRRASQVLDASCPNNAVLKQYSRMRMDDAGKYPDGLTWRHGRVRPRQMIRRAAAASMGVGKMRSKSTTENKDAHNPSWLLSMKVMFQRLQNCGGFVSLMISKCPKLQKDVCPKTPKESYFPMIGLRIEP